MSTVIKVENLCKKYTIRHEGKERYVALRDVITNKMKSFGKKLLAPSSFKESACLSKEDFWALKDISFDVKQGERIGIIGRNGAGKSTLLKLLSRITEPSGGKITLKGRVGSLLEVGTGFHPELTGRENVYLNGAILGMSRSEINAKFDEIVQFAEVEKFLDTPVKRYSSGMQVRLAFAVAAHLEPEILLVDEVLAVGDAQFQKKCLGKMEEVSGEGRTVLFVSHNMGSIKQLCSRGLVLTNGNVAYDGNVGEAVNLYAKDAVGVKTSYSYEEFNDSAIQFTEVRLRHQDGFGNEEAELIIRYLVHEHNENIILSVNINNTLNVMVYYSNDLFLNDQRKRTPGYHEISLSIPIELFSPGDYYVQFAFWEPGKIVHFPDDRIYIKIDERANPIPGLSIDWPSIIYMPDRWSYIDR